MNPAYHPGEDWNGRGGGDTDFGQPVRAVAEGVVVFAGDNLEWGNIVEIKHRLPSGELLFSVYCHLKEIVVVPGQRVDRRQLIGAVGKGFKNATYSAHLHLELRQEDMERYPANFWPRLRGQLIGIFRSYTEEELVAWIRLHYLEPTGFIRAHRNLQDAPPELQCVPPPATPSPVVSASGAWSRAARQ